MRLALLSLFPVMVAAQTAPEIMARVAENQSRAEEARAAFVYHENLLVRLKRSNGKLAREEQRDYTVTPTPTGLQREMVHFAGKYGVSGKEYPFDTPGYEYKGMDVDAGVAKGLADNFGNKKSSKDGISVDMFPLTGKGQDGYAFHLAGREKYQDRDVFRISFQPEKREHPRDWAGEALIDATEFQPVVITTHWAFQIPVAVKIIFGTNIRQMGFKVTYSKFDEGLWFPVTYGGELQVRALFLYGRTISLGSVHSDFRKADVKTSIDFH